MKESAPAVIFLDEATVGWLTVGLDPWIPSLEIHGFLAGGFKDF